MADAAYKIVISGPVIYELHAPALTAVRERCALICGKDVHDGFSNPSLVMASHIQTRSLSSEHKCWLEAREMQGPRTASYSGDTHDRSHKGQRRQSLTKEIERASKIADLPVSSATLASILRAEYGGF